MRYYARMVRRAHHERIEIFLPARPEPIEGNELDYLTLILVLKLPVPQNNSLQSPEPLA